LRISVEKEYVSFPLARDVTRIMHYSRGFIFGFVVYWTVTNEHSGRVDAAQADVRAVKLANSPTSSPASGAFATPTSDSGGHAAAALAAQAGCCKVKGTMEDEIPVVTDASTTGQDPVEKTGLAIGEFAPRSPSSIKMAGRSR
jgi:hypothetical protein